MSTLSVDTIQGQTTASKVKLPAGSVLQVLSTTKTDTFSTTSVGPIDITGLSVAITPKYATSKIFITFSFFRLSDKIWENFIFSNY